MTDIDRIAEVDCQQAVERFCVRVGYVLRMARIKRGLTVEQVQTQIGVYTVAELRHLERGDLPDASLRMIADVAFALNCECEFRLAVRARILENGDS